MACGQQVLNTSCCPTNCALLGGYNQGLPDIKNPPSPLINPFNPQESLSLKFFLAGLPLHVLREAEAGSPIKGGLCGAQYQHGDLYHAWKRKFGGMEVSKAREASRRAYGPCAGCGRGDRRIHANSTRFKSPAVSKLRSRQEQSAPLISWSSREGIPPAPTNLPASVEEGDKRYATDCSMCHGADGHTPTDIGRWMYPRAADLTGPEVQGFQ